MPVQKSGGKWWGRVNVKSADGKWRQLCIPGGFTSKQDALDAIAASKAMRRDVRQRERMTHYIEALTGEPALARSVSLSAMWARYIGLPGVKLAANTTTFRRMVIARFVAWMTQQHPGIRTMDGVDRVVAAEYLDHLHRAGKAGKTINNARGDLSAVWTELLIREGLKENVWRVVPAFRTDDSVSGRDFTPDEIARIMEAARAVGKQWPEISTAALYTGLRYGDLMGLQWASVHDGMIVMKPSKTARHGVEVAIPIHPALQAVFDGLERRGDFVFWDHQRRKTSCTRMAEFGKILNKAEVKQKKGEVLSFHGWRHTFRTRLAAAGVPADVAKRLGGWSRKSEIDAERYNHDLTGLKRAIEALQ